MKKIIIALLAAVCSLSANAQGTKFFNLGIGLNAGTNGVGLDASIGLTRFIQIRGGFSYVPEMDFNTDINIYNEAQPILNALQLNPITGEVMSHFNIEEKTNVKLQPNMLTYHALLDFYPSGSFHFTVGAYFGQERPIKVYTTDGALKSITMANAALDAYNRTFPNSAVPPIGVQAGDYVFTPDADGNVNAEIQVQKLRPYFGIGFGRAVPRKHRVGMSLDLGVQYWGKPTFYANDEEIEPSTLIKDDKTKLWSTLSTIPVYPVATLRICGRIL